MSDEQEPGKSWGHLRPMIFRYLEKEHVDAFFADGSLRVSSFQLFQTHPDETRRDGKEGQCIVVHRNTSGTGQTIMVKGRFGGDCYVLCGSMRPSQQKRFKRDSFIAIHNPVGFGIVIANAIPNCVGGADSPVIYDRSIQVHRDFGNLDLNSFQREDEPTQLDPTKAMTLAGLAGHELVYRKHDKFVKEAEYRLVWQVSGVVQPYLDLRVPEARQFCYPPDDIRVGG